jgi:integrase
MRLKNNVKSIEAAPIGRHGIDVEDVVGLYLAVTKTKDGGISRRFIWRYHRADGRPNELSLGVYGVDIDLKKATKKAYDLRHALKENGIDPGEARRAAKAPVPVIATLAATLTDYKKAFATEAGALKRVELIERHAKGLLPLATATITALNARDALADVQVSAPKTAARVRGALSSVFGYAVAHGVRPDNPCDASIWRHLAPSPPKSVSHRMMPYAEVPAFHRRLIMKDSTVALGLALLILTASRTSEILGLRWDEVDLDRHVIVIPATRMKADVEHRIPLTQPALAILAAMRHRRLSATYCFPADHGGRLSDRVFEGLLHRHFKLPYACHGFRASFSTWANQTQPFAYEDIEACLAHQIGNAVGRAYDRADRLEKRRVILQAWADYVTGGDQA